MDSRTIIASAVVGVLVLIVAAWAVHFLRERRRIKQLLRNEWEDRRKG